MATVYSAKDANGFRLRIDYTATTPGTGSTSTSPRSTVSGTMYLESTVAGEYFTSWTLTTWLNIWGSGSTTDTYPIDKNQQFSIANPSSGTTRVTLGTFTKTIFHDTTDGTGYFYLYAYVDADTNAGYVPANIYYGPTQFTLPTLAPPVPQFSYSYWAAGGSNTPTGGTVNSGTTITVGSPGTKTGYTFNYWNAFDYTNAVEGAYLGNVGSGGSWTIDRATRFFASWSVIQYTATFYSDGNVSSTQQVDYGSSATMPNASKSGYSLSGWSYGGTVYPVGSSGPTQTSNLSFTAVWVALTPGFTDETISGTVVINKNVNELADRSFSATNATSYSLSYAGTGLNPTSWLTIDNSGNLSGTTNVAGTYTFRVNATGPGGAASSNIATLVVRYPGKRINSSFAPTTFTTAKRYAPGESGADGQGWKPLSFMKRWSGSGWVDLTN
jgi:hypothetical protein